MSPAVQRSCRRAERRALRQQNGPAAGTRVALPVRMKATELLTQQHREVARLFEAIEDAKDDKQKQQLFMELAGNLVSHDGIEREIFYPACEEAMGMNDQLGEALVEHGTIEFAVYQATQAMGKDDFEFKCTVLKELVEHHVEEEEDEFFPKAEKALGDESLNLLGEEMDEAFEDKKAEDFRAPLYENLRQVFAGALKTSPAEESEESEQASRASKGKAKPTSGKHKARKSA
jgi:hemerythrin-like domain-containing protein